MLPRRDLDMIHDYRGFVKGFGAFFLARGKYLNIVHTWARELCYTIGIERRVIP